MRLSTDERIAVLRRGQAFEDLRPDDLRALAQAMTTEVFEADSVIFEEGEQGDGVHILAEGCCEVRSRASDVPLAQLHPGDLFGEYAVLLSGKRSASVVATQRSVTLYFEGRRLLAFLLDHPSAMLALWRTTVERLVIAQRATQK